MTDATTTPATPFRWRLEHRPDVRFGHAAGGVAGLLVTAAVVAFVAEVADDDARLPGVGFTLLLLAVALAAGWFVRGPVRSAAVTAIVLAVPLVWLFAIAGDGEGTGRGDIRLILLLTIAGYVLFYALTWTRGRAVLLGLALLVFANWAVFEVADSQALPAVSIAEQAQTQLDGGSFDGGGRTDDNDTEIAVVSIALGLAFLGVGVVSDRRRRVGMATPFLLVGALTAVQGGVALGVAVDDTYATGVFVALAGAAIGLAGSLGRRRGTSWIGAVVLLVGALVVVIEGTTDASDDGGTAWVFGTFALIAAAVLLGVAVLVARALDEPVDGGEPAPVPVATSRAPEPAVPEPAVPEPAVPEPDTTGGGSAEPPPESTDDA